MLAVTKYPADYVAGCRARIVTQIKAYDALAGEIAGAGGAALSAFEAEFFANLILVLDSCFVHRTRAIEGKDGNALNEVRVVGASLLQNGGVMGSDKTIRLDPARSILKLAPGDRIALTQADFVHLADAFFAEIDARFT